MRRGNDAMAGGTRSVGWWGHLSRNKSNKVRTGANAPQSWAETRLMKGSRRYVRRNSVVQDQERIAQRRRRCFFFGVDMRVDESGAEPEGYIGWRWQCVQAVTRRRGGMVMSGNATGKERGGGAVPL
jgi:hypothetical protein